MRKFLSFLAVFIVLVAGVARQAEAIPADDLLNSLEPTGDVNDYAGLLSPAEKEALEARCRQLREKTAPQLAIVTLQSLRGGEIDDFASKLFARWGIGQKDKKNGLLLIVALDERKSRIEVGYGLEPIIPDVLAGRILDHQLRPQFRQQQYAQGLSVAANALIELVERGEPADRDALAAQERGRSGATLSAIVFITAFVIVGSFMAGSGLGTRTLPIILFGLFLAGMAILIGILAWPLAPLLQVPLSVVTGVAGYYFARYNPKTPRGGSRRRSGGGSSWNWTDFSGSSGTGWSSGGGGFSTDWGGFGGGSSGGGGASSSW